MAKTPEVLLHKYAAEDGGQNPSSAAEVIDGSMKFKTRSTELGDAKNDRGSVLYVDVYQELTIRDLAEALLAALSARPIQAIH